MSKEILLAYAVIALLASCGKTSDKGNLDEKALSSVTGVYGDPLSDRTPHSLSQMQGYIRHEGNFEGKVTGIIKEVCTHKGCWMTLALPDGSEMRVTFKDYSFFVPKNVQGYSVTLEGVAEISVTEVDMLKHYAKDAGKPQVEIDAITEPEESVAFEAFGVVIEEGV
ncbi:DUF4920 domain-containing protein [Lunatimonas salinarum]|uniref:DUF4920 domain-containing protein n=1 Tax=Lunatimonas salinarum TaxID=1774590 RepID=UPI001ADEE8CD|nr:DUF4920 domain-containing protein [Lunatimonas salinarum]